MLGLTVEILSFFSWFHLTKQTLLLLRYIEGIPLNKSLCMYIALRLNNTILHEKRLLCCLVTLFEIKNQLLDIKFCVNSICETLCVLLFGVIVSKADASWDKVKADEYWMKANINSIESAESITWNNFQN